MEKVRADYLTRIKPHAEEPMSRKPVCMTLPMDADEFVRSLPNRAEWLRQAVLEKMQREAQPDAQPGS